MHPASRILNVVLLSATATLAQDEAPVLQPAPPLPPGVEVPADPQPQAPGQVQPPAGQRVPGAQPAVPGGRPANANGGNAALADTKITEPIEEPKLSGNALAGLYEKYTGRRVIVSQAAATAEFSFIQGASPSRPLTYGLAAQLLRKAATVESFVFVPDPDIPELDFLTLATGGVRPTGIGVDVYSEGMPFPEGNAVISYVMNLQYIKPDEAVRTFTQVIGQFGAFGSIAPVPNAAAVVITENTTLIRKLIDLKKEIDKPSSQVGTRFIRVQFADVTELATTLTELLTAQQTTQRSAGNQRVANAAGGTPEIPQAAGAAGGGSSSGEETPIQIVPDPRTNRIFAMGRPVDLVFVEGLVREFDTETDNRNFLRRKLKFLKVNEFLPIAGDALSRAFSGTGEAGAAGGAGGAAGGNRAGAAGGAGSTAARSTGTSAAGANSRTSATGGGGTGTGSRTGSASSASGSALSDPNVTSAPESLLVGRTLLVADNITNSIVVQGPPSGVEIIEKLLDQVDVRADQVLISTVFGQLTLTDDFNLGVDILSTINDAGDFAGRGGGGSGPSIPLGTTPLFTPGSLGANAGLSIYGKIGNKVNVYINALQEKTDFIVLSRPSIFTGNNQRGVISSGQKIAVPTNSFNSGTTGQSTNIEYQDVVLKLEVVALVNSPDEITLQISLINDEVIDTTTISSGDSDIEVPLIGTRELLTTVTVPNNETVVLGGLVITRDNKTVRGVPILSSIPGLGKLFSTNIKSKERNELIIFIQPSVVTNSAALDEVQRDTDYRYQSAEQVRAFGDGPGLLPPTIPETGKGGERPVKATIVPKKQIIRPGASHGN